MIPMIFPLIVSTSYITLTSLIAHWARKYIYYYIKEPFIQSLILEGVAAAELCAICFELIIIADNWGVLMYALYLFLLTIWWGMNWGNATACPYTHFEEAMEGKKSLCTAFMFVWTQTLSGIVIFRYIQLLWGLEIVHTHENKAYGDCITDLQVSPKIGALVECVATCIYRIVSRVLCDINVEYANIIDSFVGTSLVVLAFNYSGGYFNPALATSLKYGCSGTTFMEHVIVYWFGSCAGSLISLKVYNISLIQNFIKKYQTDK
ncbi:hypothetical protein M0802_013388 [Mischocyttarus mexicanus]|nr:hypothetical protein M0802_013396 [Mischocyttarus mexicanus]KAI4483446.1 hypothetical protein M0802_013388 [Mischocyttarus mexicanus]